MLRTAIRVVIADDHPLLLAGAKLSLQQQPALQVVGTAANFSGLLELLRTVITDVVILDLENMGTGPSTMVRRLKQDYPRVAIIIFSSNYHYADILVPMGIQGYLIKEEPPERLVQAIHAAMRNEVTLSSSVVDVLNRAEFVKSHTNMTEREHDVIRLLAKGFSTLEIANQLMIDPRTAQNYLTALRRKTGLFQRGELIAWYRNVLARGPKEAG